MVKFSDIFDKNDKDKKESKEKKGPLDKTKESSDKVTPSIDFSAMFAKKEAAENKPQQPEGEKPKRQPPAAKKEPQQFNDFSTLLDKNKAKPVEPEVLATQELLQCPNTECMFDLYNEAVAFSQRLFTSSVELNGQDLQELARLVERMITCIKQDDQGLVKNVFTQHLDEIQWYVYNLVNVCILSLETGVALDYTDHQLLKLGVAAFLHDIGLKAYRDFLEQKRKLSVNEKKQLERVPSVSADMVRRIQNELIKNIAEIIAQTHERINGAGYPRGLKADDIDECAQIIGMVDVYEALTHSRPYRAEKFTVTEAFKIILGDSRGVFNSKLTKKFLEMVGFYPKGTCVELNTKEVALVIKQNPKMPSCPLIKVTYNAQGELIRDGREIDLAKGTRTFIVKNL